jgi:hypothetical protein
MTLTDAEAYKPQIDRHLAFLRSSEWRITRFQQQLNANAETAVSEACLRDWLEERGHRVEAAEDRSAGGPDFRVDDAFYVECTCITRDAATKASKLKDMPAPGDGAVNYAQMTDSFKRECVGKAAQCAVVNDLPCLLAICTLHVQAGMLCFGKRPAEFILTSQPMITSRFNPQKGDAVGNFYQTTDLRSAAFLRPAKTEDAIIEAARRTIAGVILCPFGVLTPDIVGVLHDEALRPFDRTLLPEIPFCRLKLGYHQGVFETEWC